MISVVSGHVPLFALGLRHVFSKALKGFSANVSDQAAAQIAANPQVAYYEPNQIYWATDRKHQAKDDDRIVPAGPGRGPGRDDDDDPEQPEQVTPWGIGRVGGPNDGSGLHAWVIDSGIDLDHPDLNVGYGANFVILGSEDGSDPPEDAAGHGTHVAGTIAALDNGIDVVGVAPSATVHPVRVLSRSGFGMTDWIVAGIDYVAANAAPGDCANMSLGGPVISMSGTSMAAPHVCGILLHSNEPATDGFAVNDPDGDPDPIAHQVLSAD